MSDSVPSDHKRIEFKYNSHVPPSIYNILIQISIVCGYIFDVGYEKFNFPQCIFLTCPSQNTKGYFGTAWHQCFLENRH